jgi:spore maturation protein CgeB
LRDVFRYFLDPYYWRKAILRVVEKLTGQQHLETYVDRVVADVWLLASSRVGTVEDSCSRTRLLYVAPKFDYGNPARGYSYEENHFLPALLALGFNTIRFDSLTLVRLLGRRRASELLAELAFRTQPEVAFFVLFRDEFEPWVVEELRKLGCVTFNWFTDDHWRFESFSSRWAPRFSYAITTDPRALARYRERGITNVIRSQWGVNHHLYRPLDRPRRYQATFIGQPHGERRAVLRRLAAAGVRVEAWGYGWPRGKLTTREAVQVINESAVNLNFSQAVTRTVEQIKGRDFEVPACRGLLLTGRVEAIEEYFQPGKEILVYDSFEEMVAQIRWALAHPGEADRIREAGYRRVLAEHTYERRFTEIFRQAGIFV